MRSSRKGVFVFADFNTKGCRLMKKIITYLLVLTTAVMLLLGTAACGKHADRGDENGLWENAIYLSDTELGKGENTAVVEVKADNRTVAFTIHTDSKTVGEALAENNLIAGDEGEYGIYIKAVNGITADYDVNQSYWAFYADGEYALSGADSTEISENTVYQLVYTK